MEIRCVQDGMTGQGRGINGGPRFLGAPFMPRKPAAWRDDVPCAPPFAEDDDLGRLRRVFREGGGLRPHCFSSTQPASCRFLKRGLVTVRAMLCGKLSAQSLNVSCVTELPLRFSTFQPGLYQGIGHPDPKQIDPPGQHSNQTQPLKKQGVHEPGNRKRLIHAAASHLGNCHQAKRRVHRI